MRKGGGYRVPGYLLVLSALVALSPHVHAFGDLTPEGAKLLEESAKRMQPVPYQPQPGGCARWEGRAMLSLYNGQLTACIGACALRMVETDGYNARWEFTGDVCGGGRLGRQERPGRSAGGEGHREVVAPAASNQARPGAAVVLPEERVVPKGQARNFRGGDEPIVGPPPGYRAAARKR